MKKQIITLALLAIIGLSANAQHYYPLPDSNVTWIVAEPDGIGGYYYYNYFTDSINKDTMINSKIYTKIFSGIYMGAYRSDTLGFTYYVPVDSNREYILRDISKNTGDTIKNIFIFTNYNHIYPNDTIVNLHVDSVNYTLAGPYNLKRMYLSNHAICSVPYSYLVWIEKIGALTGGFFNYLEVNIMGGGEIIYCMNYNDTIYYDNYIPSISSEPTYYQGQCDNPTNIININYTNNISVYPNPANDNLTIETGDLRSTNYKVRIEDVVGNTVLEKTLYNKETNIDHVGWSSYVVDVSSLSSGVYFINVYTENGVAVKKFIKE